MKRKLIGSILGMGAAVTMAHAQGHVLLNNYSFNPYGSSSYYGDPVLYGAGSGGTVGAKVAASSGFNLELAYELGTATGSSATSQNGPAGTLDAGFTETGTTGLVGGGFGVAGYFEGGTVTIADYTSGPITFEFLAFNGSDYADSTIRGHSEAVTLASIATGLTPSTQLSGFSSAGFYVTTVPEPATMGLLGLGAAGLMYFRRRKA
jgi:PEP-CTERM motif